MLTNSVVVLPRDFSGLTVDGKAFVTPRPAGQWVLFRTWRGKGGNLHGYLFTSREVLKVGEEIEVVTMRSGKVGKCNVVVESKEDDSWYFVAWGME